MDILKKAFEFVFFKVLSTMLSRYNIKFIYQDRLNVLSKRDINDNYKYLFRTGNSCDANPMMEALDDKICNSKLGFDIGANIGITTAWMAKHCEHVYAFEPEPNNRARLEETLALNHASNVTIISTAVSNKIGKALLHIHDSYGHHSLGDVATSKTIGHQEIDTTTLDKFCLENEITEIDFLKVDVEGFELEVFQGAEDLLNNHKIKLIAFEISRVPLESLGRLPAEIYDILQAAGYTISDIHGGPLDYHDNPLHIDLIAYPKAG